MDFQLVIWLLFLDRLSGQQTGPLHIYHAYSLMHILLCDLDYTHEAPDADVTIPQEQNN